MTDSWRKETWKTAAGKNDLYLKHYKTVKQLAPRGDLAQQTIFVVFSAINGKPGITRSALMEDEELSKNQVDGAVLKLKKAGVVKESGGLRLAAARQAAKSKLTPEAVKLTNTAWDFRQDIERMTTEITALVAYPDRDPSDDEVKQAVVKSLKSFQSSWKQLEAQYKLLVKMADDFAKS